MFIPAILSFLSFCIQAEAMAVAPPGASLSNAATSLTFLYQNNLNASDDVNHVGAILLDATPERLAAAACAQLNETLLPIQTLNAHKVDFLQQFAYLSYSRDPPSSQTYNIAGGELVVDTRLQSFSLLAHRNSEHALPVLCTQSASDSTSSAPAAPSNLISVSASGNTYTGFRNKKSFRFIGIPYANPFKRWAYSTPYSSTGQSIKATAYGPQCAQGGSGAEDCLFLNIQTPYIPKAGSKTEANLKPVLFWIHGGGFTGGSGADPLSDGGNLASREDIVVVNINYRLSTLGFLAIPGTEIRGNYGIADQVTALQWTIKNIAFFGGDPHQITIMGESAGAGSVRTLLGSPRAIGLFQGAVAMSNLGGGVGLGLSGDYATTYSSYDTIEQSYATAGQSIFKAAGCTQADLQTQIACLGALDALKVVGLGAVARYVVQDGTYVDTEQLIVAERNRSTAHIPVIFGTTRDDGASFNSYPSSGLNLTASLAASLGISLPIAQSILDSRLFPSPGTGNITADAFNISSRVATDIQFRCIDQATSYTAALTNAFEKSYYYQIDRTIDGYDPNHLGGPKNNNPNNPYYRVHGSDMPFLLGTLSNPRNADDLNAERLITGYFASFIRTGDPNPDKGFLQARGYATTSEVVRETGRWEQVRGKTGPIRHLDWPGKKGAFVDTAQCEWLGYGLDYYFDGGR